MVFVSRVSEECTQSQPLPVQRLLDAMQAIEQAPQLDFLLQEVIERLQNVLCWHAAEDQLQDGMETQCSIAGWRLVVFACVILRGYHASAVEASMILRCPHIEGHGHLGPRHSACFMMDSSDAASVFVCLYH